jgi:hypothetical protein
MLSGSQATRVGEEDAGRSHKGYVLAGRRAPRAGSIEQKGGQEGRRPEGHKSEEGIW